jgi:MFS transporter, DHA1 family, multidrug resistance protein
LAGAELALSQPLSEHTQGTSGQQISASFVILMALMTSLVALSIDGMLPALAQIAQDLNVPEPNHRQYVLSTLFLGMVVGQLIYGPISDTVGRKRPVVFGCALFIFGCLLSALADSFAMMLFGRFVQGLGAAGPRIVIIAIIRDQYQGAAMARVMSLIMTVFIIVPALAPSLGQAMLWFGSWRLIFFVFSVLALTGLVWFWLRQAETLPVERRAPLKLSRLLAATKEVFTHPVALGYTLTAGLVFAAFIGFLNSAQQILQEQYLLGDQFPLYFAALALALGASTLTNSKLVKHFALPRLCRWSLTLALTWSAAFSMVALVCNGHPPLWSLMLFLMLLFYVIGILFGNMNALAMEPMGHIAGLASAVIASITTLMSMSLGGLIGSLYNGTVLPLVIGYAVLSLLALTTLLVTERRR